MTLLKFMFEPSIFAMIIVLLGYISWNIDNWLDKSIKRIDKVFN